MTPPTFPLCRSLGLSVVRYAIDELTPYGWTYHVNAADLEKLLSGAVRVKRDDFMTTGSWHDERCYSDGSGKFAPTQTALLIGITPIKRERTAQLSEAQVREALFHPSINLKSKEHDEIIERLFGTNSEGAGGV